jgi:hypothetical protein
LTPAQIRDQHAVSGEMSRRGGNDHLRNAQLLRDERRMQRPGATVGDHDEVARVESALGRYARDDVRHRTRGDPDDSVRGLDNADAERLGDLGAQGLGRGLEIEPHLAAEESVGRKTAQDQVRVGDGGL